MKRLWPIVALLFAGFPAAAQDTLRITLSGALEQVEANYPALRQYHYNARSLEAQAEGAAAWMAPNFSTGLMRFPYNTSLLKEQMNPMNQAGIGFSIEQMIPDRGRQGVRRRHLQAQADVENYRRDWTLNALRREV